MTQYHQPSKPDSFKFMDKYINISMSASMNMSRTPRFGGHVMNISENNYRIYYNNIKEFLLTEKNGKDQVQPVCIRKCYKLSYYTTSKEDAELYYDSFDSVANYYKRHLK